MSLSRRKFISTAAGVGGAALASSRLSAAPYQVALSGNSHAVASGPHTAGVPVMIPASMPMGSGAPLGGIGTGFVEIRPDGCFHEWEIFNAGSWAPGARSTTASNPNLQFVLRTKSADGDIPQVRRLYLRSGENDLYSLPLLQDVESIRYYSQFPMTGLQYQDPTLPVEVSARIFSPLIPGKARESGTPGFHIVYTIENTSKETTEVSLAGFMDNPLASALADRKLTNTLSRENGTTRILLNTAAESDFPSGIGNMCLSVTNGEHSYITGTFHEYAWPGTATWSTPRVNMMVISVIEELVAKGKLPDTNGETDPSIGLPTDTAIDALSDAEVRELKQKLGSDALLARIFADAREANQNGGVKADRELLKEVVDNISGNSRRSQMNWGSTALAASVVLKPGQRKEIRFTLSWYFPNHLTSDGQFMGHMYSNWYNDAAEVNSFLCANYSHHFAATDTFAQTLANTSLGDPLSFCWSSQLSTLVFNTWWTKDGGYAIWEGLGCCGLSTTDVDYQGSFPIVALFPELKLGQMKQIIGYQNSEGQVPHNYSGFLHQVDNGFMRVDMNPQFVMMVCRDFLWTGDRDYLTTMWPHIERAMAFTESLDTNGDALPDHNTGLQTYDQWRMRGTPAYVASLWIGGLRAAVRIATDLGKHDEAQRWSGLLEKASKSFDNMLFNGEYYSLWADGAMRDELCMTDQISGEWFSSLIGLPGTLSQAHLNRAIGNIFKFNFNTEFGLHNATAPKRNGKDLLALVNLQAGGLWSGIEFAFASLLMDHGYYADGVRIVEAVYRRYLRAGQPWNHVECGGHYSRAMSSWATMLAATGFKPDVPNQSLGLNPTAPGDFHAPWVTATGYGTVQRTGHALTIHCVSGKLELKQLKTLPAATSVSLNGRTVASWPTKGDSEAVFQFASVVSLTQNGRLSIALAGA